MGEPPPEYAGLAAVGVAMFPMYAEKGYIPLSNKLHVACAVTLFVCIGLTAMFCHSETLQWVDDDKKRARYKKIYVITGIVMAASPLMGILMAYAADAIANRVYWVEAAGIWAFSAYWITKSIELKETEMEAHAVRATKPMQVARAA